MFAVSVDSFVRGYRTYGIYRAFFPRGESLIRIAQVIGPADHLGWYRAQTVARAGSTIAPQELLIRGSDLLILKEGGEV